MATLPPSGISPEDLPEEPKQAFHCLPPSESVKQQYAYLYDLDSPIPMRWSKRIFDVVVSGTALLLLSPVLLALFVAGKIEGVLRPSSRGPFVTSYIAASAGKPFRKHKIRQVKMSAIDADLAKKGYWHAYLHEWSPESLTSVGSLVKALYLDELPQLWTVLIGEMSLVGPRPLAWHHYERDLAQGNVARRLLRAGLLGPGQAQKGTSMMGDPTGEFVYAELNYKGSGLQVLKADVDLIIRGIMVVFRKRGL